MRAIAADRRAIVRAATVCLLAAVAVVWPADCGGDPGSGSPITRDNPSGVVVGLVFEGPVPSRFAYVDADRIPERRMAAEQEGLAPPTEGFPEGILTEPTPPAASPASAA